MKLQSPLAALTLVALAAASAPAAAGYVSSWNAASGLYPDQISPPYSLFDSSPADPVLAGGVLTVSTSAQLQQMYYRQLDPIVDTSGAFFIEARLRLVSGAASHASRAPISITFTTAPNVGNALQIHHDSVFFLTDNLVAGTKVAVDTNDAFHTYRIESDGAGGLTLDWDGTQILTGATFLSADANGPTERITWGQGSQLAFGTSEWAYFTHDALAVPEPQTYALLLAGLGLLGLIRGQGRNYCQARLFRRAANPNNPSPASSSA